MLEHRLVEPWTLYWCKLAELTATRSKDPNRQVGAVVIDNYGKRVLGMGYNGPPRYFVDHNIDWSKPNKYNYILHAEINALYDAIDKSGKRRLHNALMITTLHPCNQCLLHMMSCGLKACGYLDVGSDFNENEDLLKKIAYEGQFDLYKLHRPKL